VIDFDATFADEVFCDATRRDARSGDDFLKSFPLWHMVAGLFALALPLFTVLAAINRTQIAVVISTGKWATATTRLWCATAVSGASRLAGCHSYSCLSAILVASSTAGSNVEIFGSSSIEFSPMSSRKYTVVL